MRLNRRLNRVAVMPTTLPMITSMPRASTVEARSQ